MLIKQINFPDINIETSPIIEKVLDASIVKGSIELRSEGISAKILALTQSHIAELKITHPDDKEILELSRLTKKEL